MSHIFISYSRNDIDFAQKIVDALAANNLDTWIDWKSIPKGEDWEQEIYRGIEEADAFLFLISPESVTSKMCNKEIAHAVKNGKRILPIFIANVENQQVYGVTEQFLGQEQKREINRRNFVFCRDRQDDFNNAIEQIRETIHTDYEWVKYHTKLQVKALDWEPQKDNSRLLRGKELQDAEQEFAVAGIGKDPQPTELQRTFIQTSRIAEREEQRRLAEERRKTNTRIKNLIYTLGAIGMLTALSLLLATSFSRQAKISSLQAQNADATAQAEANAHATAQIMEEHARATADAEREGAGDPELDTRPDLALLRAAESAKKDHNYSTLNGLLRVLQYKPAPYTFFFGHKKVVTALAFSTNTQQIASGSEENTVYVWSRSTGQITTKLNVGFAATALQFSPDDRYLVIGINDTVRAWDMNASTWMAQFSTAHSGTLTDIVFNRKGDEIAVSYEDGKILLFDFRSAKLRLQINAGSRIDGLAFNADGSLLAGGYAVSVSAWDTNTGEMVKSYYEFGGFAKGLRFASDNELYVYGGWQGSYQIRNVETGEIIWSLEKPPEWFRVESLSDDGHWLITSGYGERTGTILLWDIGGTKQMSFRVIKQSYAAKCLSFSPDSRYLALSGDSQGVQILDKDSGFQQFTFPSTSTIQCARFVSNSLILAYDKDNVIRHLDVNSGKESNTSLQIADEILDLDAVNTAEGTAAITTCTQKNTDDRCIKKEIEYYDYVSNKLRNSISLETNGGNTGLSSNGKWIAIVNPEPPYTLALWDLSADTKKNRILSGIFSWILDIKFSPDKSHLAASSQGDGSIYLWNLTSHQRNADILVGHNYMAPALAFSPDGKLLVSGGCSQRSGMGCYRGEIRIWDVDSHQLIGKPLVDAHKDWIGQLVFSPDGSLLISIDWKGKIEAWPIGYDAWINKVCRRAGRNFTQAEWAQYFPNEDYRITCPQWPAGE